MLRNIWDANRLDVWRVFIVIIVLDRSVLPRMQNTLNPDGEIRPQNGADISDGNTFEKVGRHWELKNSALGRCRSQWWFRDSQCNARINEIIDFHTVRSKRRAQKTERADRRTEEIFSRFPDPRCIHVTASCIKNFSLRRIFLYIAKILDSLFVQSYMVLSGFL